MNSVMNSESGSRFPRVIILGENASMKMGGEASFPYLFFKLLRDRGVEAWLVAHARTRDEMHRLMPDEIDRMHFVEESPLDVFLWKVGAKLPRKIDEQTIGMVRHILTHRRLRKVIVGLIAQEHANIVHETTPISPKAPSAMYGLGVPVVAGPLSGAMDFPPAFQHLQSQAARIIERGGRAVSHVANWLVPGKIRADALVLANDQTLKALPKGYQGKVYEGISEVSVNMKVWKLGGRATRAADGLVRFSYLGRLVEWKAVDLLLDAFKIVSDRCPQARLEILGDGETRQPLEAQSSRLGLTDRVEFGGWVSAEEGARRLRSSDVFVLPSLRESGGVVLLEAMAVGLPVVASRWGGPGVHVDDATGFRVFPDSREGFVNGLADSMIRLANSPELRETMGRAAIRRVESGTYDWDRKIDRFLEIYAETIEGHAAKHPQREQQASPILEAVC
jgi:glycosyltransferase involved in cell wall biosynthesis